MRVLWATAAPQARFPAFFGPGHDWLPDHNRGGAGLTGIHEMFTIEVKQGEAWKEVARSTPSGPDKEIPLTPVKADEWVPPPPL